MNRLNKYKSDKKYRAKCNLLQKILRQETVKLEALRRADDLMDRVVRNLEFQGYTNLPGCSRVEIHTLRVCGQLGDLSGENSPVFESFLTGMDKAERDKRNASANIE